jgi:hypothetical protein
MPPTPNKVKAVASVVQIHKAKVRSINVTCRLVKVPLATRPAVGLATRF